MLTQVVVLFMATQLNMPGWCKALVGIGIGINIIRFLYGLYKAGRDSRKGCRKSIF